MVDSGLTRLTPLIGEAASVEGDAELGRLLRTLVNEAKTTTGSAYAALGVLGGHRMLSDFIHQGVSEDVAARIGHPPTGRGVLGAVIHADEAIVLEAISDHPASIGFPEHHPPMESFLGVPVTAGGERFGNLYLTEKEGGFTDADVAVVEALSHIAGAAIQSARLHARLRRVALIEDRQRIARDLHDSVIQDLFAVGLGLQSLAHAQTDENLVDKLTSAIDTLDDSVAMLRRYIFELKESPFPATGLDERLQQLVARLGSAYPARVELSLGTIGDGPWVDDAVLLATEALSNALRHSGATHVEVSAGLEDDYMVVVVTDNGGGFEDGSEPRGLGLHSMRTRAEAHGGWTTVESSPSQGTSVVARFPVRSAGPDGPEPQ